MSTYITPKVLDELYRAHMVDFEQMFDESFDNVPKSYLLPLVGPLLEPKALLEKIYLPRLYKLMEFAAADFAVMPKLVRFDLLTQNMTPLPDFRRVKNSAELLAVAVYHSRHVLKNNRSRFKVYNIPWDEEDFVVNACYVMQAKLLELFPVKWFLGKEDLREQTLSVMFTAFFRNIILMIARGPEMEKTAYSFHPWFERFFHFQQVVEKMDLLVAHGLTPVQLTSDNLSAKLSS